MKNTLRGLIVAVGLCLGGLAQAADTPENPAWAEPSHPL